MTEALAGLVTAVRAVLLSVTDLGEEDTLDCLSVGLLDTPELSRATLVRTLLFVLSSGTVSHPVTSPAGGDTLPVYTLEL